MTRRNRFRAELEDGWKLVSQRKKRLREESNERRRGERVRVAKEVSQVLPVWEWLVAAHRWRRILEEGGALPPGFDGEAFATDRYAAIGDGPDLVGARLHFVREIEGISAPCHAFETRDWEVLAHLVERGCSCDLHEPETSRCALDLEGLGDLMQSPARERAHTLGGRN